MREITLVELKEFLGVEIPCKDIETEVLRETRKCPNCHYFDRDEDVVLDLTYIR